MVARVVMTAGLICLSITAFAGRATAAVEREQCPNEASRQGPSAALPECRVYEQVTPVDKGDALDLFTPFTDGSHLLLQTAASLALRAPSFVASYVFSRGATGWEMSLPAPATPQLQAVETELFDQVDLSEIGFRDLVGATYPDLYGGDPSALQISHMVGPLGGPFATVSSLSGVAFKTNEHLVGGSEDLSEAIVESEQHTLVPHGAAENQVEGSHALYEWASSVLHLVNVNTNGSLVSECGASLGQGGTGGERGAAHSAVSSDGARIFFTAPDPGARGLGRGCWNPSAPTSEQNPPEIYMRERGANESYRTIEISLPEEGVALTEQNPLEPAVFVGAADDGSRVYFVTKTELTADATGHDPELYEYDTETGKLMLVSKGGPGVEGNVDFVSAVSSEGQVAYFAAFGALTPDAQAHAPESELSPVNLYRYDAEAPEGHRLTFVTEIEATDYPVATENRYVTYTGWPNSEYVFGQAGRAMSVGLAAGTNWYTTANGGYLVFGSFKPITGFDNENGNSPGYYCERLLNSAGFHPSNCMELFRYDAAAGNIVCISCAGGRPIDNATFARDAFLTDAAGSPRPISEDGGEVFFDTQNALTPNVIPGHDHVYEWHEGAISLISSPEDPGNAFFLGASANGENVFFSTHAQLAPADTDQADDIYDARVDGGFAGVASPVCTGTGCQGVPAAAPIFATPASVTFAGGGNPPHEVKREPRRCKRGQTKKHGRCVKKQRRSAKKRR
jgi:hypothetical protein